MDVPIPILDREIALAAASSAAARLEIAAGARGSPPLDAHRRVSSRTTYAELGERADDPLAAAARAWVYVLTIERVTWPESAGLGEAWREPSIEVRVPERGRMSPRDLRRRVLVETSDARRRAWADAFAEGGGPISDRARILVERRAHAASLLDAEMADRLELPCEPQGAIAASASALLDRTLPMVRLEGSWSDAIAAGLARDAADGWPARLGARWLEEVLREGGVAAGLSIRLGPLPEALGAASFARGLGALGAAIAVADGPTAAPFSLAHPPFDLRVARRSALFASLAADPVFGRRCLGLGRDAAREQARKVARALLVGLRLDAARVLLRGALLLSSRERPERFEEVTSRALGAPIPPALGGVLPVLAPADATRFAGALLAATDRRALIDHFDEDWFRNPAAAEALRGEDADLPASLRTTGDALSGGLEALVEGASSILG